MEDFVKLAHGSGRGLEELLDNVILPSLYPKGMGILEDAAVLPPISQSLAFTTDSFVVNPIEFPGGDIGKLAACGTINDLAMMGAIPQYISVALILEEGFSLSVLRRVLHSTQTTCQNCHVVISCGDTKVVPKGKADGIFMNTAGIGAIPSGRHLSVSQAKPGDIVIVSGDIGRHGITVLSQRERLGFASSAVSDCAPLHDLVETLLAAAPTTCALRDATRGGCAAVLHEIAKASQVSIIIQEAAIPVSDVVQGACLFLGMEPLQIANEGTMIAVVPAQAASAALEALHSHPLGRSAAIIGHIIPQGHFPVMMETRIQGKRMIENPPGELLPRIC